MCNSCWCGAKLHSCRSSLNDSVYITHADDGKNPIWHTNVGTYLILDYLIPQFLGNGMDSGKNISCGYLYVWQKAYIQRAYTLGKIQISNIGHIYIIERNIFTLNKNSLNHTIITGKGY